MHPTVMETGLLGRPIEQKNSFVSKIGRADDETHTVSVDLDLVSA